MKLEGALKLYMALYTLALGKAAYAVFLTNIYSY
jgi:hypothetical protein